MVGVSMVYIRNLIHFSNSILEIATNFKEQGNDYFKGKRYREALGFYTQGIDAKPTDEAVLEALYCNRAACNLELRKFGVSCKLHLIISLARKLRIRTQGLLKSSWN